MSARAIRLAPVLLSLFFSGFVSATSGTNGGAQPIILYTPYTEIFVPPGESVNYPLDLINKGNAESRADISVSGLPKGWTWS